MARHSTLRASDADRDAVAERLRQAAVEGRLEPDELEERLHSALRARTYGDLRRQLVDLPAKSAAWDRQRATMLPVARTAFAVALRVAMVIAVIAAVIAVAAVVAASWMFWVAVLLVARGCRGRCAPLRGRRTLARPL